jgi:hypothetical protein
VLASGTLAELRGRLGEKDLVRMTGAFPTTCAPALAGLPGAEIVTSESGAIVLAIPGASRVLPAVFAAIEASGGSIQDTTISQPSLESLFIALTGRELRE